MSAVRKLALVIASIIATNKRLELVSKINGMSVNELKNISTDTKIIYGDDKIV